MGCGSSKQDSAATGMNGAPLVFLPRDDPDHHTRSADLSRMRQEYALTFAADGAMPYVNDIPKREHDSESARHSRSLTADVIGTVAKLGFNKGLDLASELFRSEGPFDDWSDLFPMCEVPSVARRWRTDEEFARQRLNGTMGQLIRRIHALPANFPVTEDLVRDALRSHGGVTLAELFAQKRVYLCDYKKLDGLPVPADRTGCAPLALFFTDSKDVLMPLAIQLTQRPEEGPIFVPTDPPGLWLAVKIHCQVADAALSEMAVHLAQMHLLPEAAYIAMMRHLHARHPLHQFLEPHFWFTMLINDGGRKNLLLPGHSIDRLYALGHDGIWALLGKEMASCNWGEEFNIPKQMADRDVGDLKNYFYRDDALLVWKVIQDYCTAIVNDFYASDEALRLDGEVQAWFQEMVAPTHGKKGFGMIGLPVDSPATAGGIIISSRSSLALFLSELLFVVTAGHAAVNDQQFELMGFVPNKPQMFRLPLPKTKDDISLTTIAAALPGFAASTEQIALMHVLSKTTNDPIGSYEDGFLQGKPSTKPIVKKFLEDLRAVSSKIEARDATLTIKYPYLNPKTIAQSVAI